MTKRQIIKWLESQSEKALAEVETQSEKALNTYYAERNERIGLEDAAVLAYLQIDCNNCPAAFPRSF